MMMQIKLFKDQALDGYTMLEAFPGIGLVGAMAGSYIIEKLEMKQIGIVESDLFPPITAVHGGTPMFPARIYKSDNPKLVLFMAEFQIPLNGLRPLSQEMLSFAKKYSISGIVSVGGIPSIKPTEKIYLVSNGDVKKASSETGITSMEDGLIGGISALLLNYSGDYGISATDILVEIDPSIMDPKYAELAITGLNKLLGINIDLSELDKEAKLVEAKIREMLKKLKEHQDQLGPAAQPPPPTDQSMYA